VKIHNVVIRKAETSSGEVISDGETVVLSECFHAFTLKQTTTIIFSVSQLTSHKKTHRQKFVVVKCRYNALIDDLSEL
jgi:hypothetical protein